MSEAESFSKKTGRCYIHNSPNCRYCGGFCEVCGVNETKTKCDSCWKLSCNDCIAEVHSGSHGVPWALEKEGHKIVCEKCIEDYYDYVDKYAESFSAEEKDRFAWKRTLREKHDKLPYDATWEETLIVEIMRLRGRLEQRGFDPHAKIGDEKYAESFSAMDDECETCTDPTDPTEDEWCGELCEKCVYDGRTNCKLCCQTNPRQGDIELHWPWPPLPNTEAFRRAIRYGFLDKDGKVIHEVNRFFAESFGAETIKPMTIGLGLGIVALFLWGRNR